MMKKPLIFALIAMLMGGQVLADTPTADNQNPAWSKQYGGADKSYDQQLLTLREQIAPRFQQLSFKDEKTGRTMEYNLYIPKNYDPNQQYPLVMFMADASTVGKGVKAPLMQGYGGIIWATDEVQDKQPTFVLVPAYAGPQAAVNDDWQTSDEVATTLDLLENVVSRYNIDRNRLYTTGQSMGGMMSFYFNATHPDLFAASLFVGSQWDVNVLKPLAKEKFFYIVSAGDPKASKGMAELGQLFHQLGVKYGEIEFSAKLPEAEQNAKVQQLIAEGYPINFVQFTAGSVLPENIEVNSKAGDHMYSFDYAYLLPAVRDWLLSQKKD
ncbi:alpha/beta hydrolase-fold protein [Volucribacter amazonae]|uniref:Pyrroline-5-carboxylate reductase n=1 Tax=Volucribacter amazonae TaxID=256731 RepID=A0A9X4PBV9_9PAST|nr:alpha/beta hydrolase-fold protein [Volucribacter amazonae]MDG6895307.1 pyrroline-5-carboxylate reductase [Volucribacter amazonae]